MYNVTRHGTSCSPTANAATNMVKEQQSSPRNSLQIMKRWNQVAIVGVGLIGGSIGLALRERKLADVVLGIGRRSFPPPRQ